jgi:hypothetical protein
MIGLTKDHHLLPQLFLMVVTHGVNGGPGVEDTPLVLDGLTFKYRDVRPKGPTTYATPRHSDM